MNPRLAWEVPRVKKSRKLWRNIGFVYDDILILL